MKKYEVGQIVSEFANHQEGALFDMSDSGAELYVFFRKPTSDEVEQFKSGQRFEIRFTEIHGVIMLLFKIGTLNWMDAPYSPHLSKNLTEFVLPEGEQGLSLTLTLADAATGEVKAIRLIGLSNNFTKKFFGTVMDQKLKDFNAKEYNIALNKIYSLYPTNKLVKMSNTYCKLN